MEGKQIIKSKLKYPTIIILIVGGVVFTFSGYYVFSIGMEVEYPQIISLVFGLLFGLLGVMSIISFFWIDRLVITDEKLIVKSIFNYPKKVIYFKDILSYTEIEKENKYRKWKDLTIFTRSHKYKISSSVVSNYPVIRSKLTANKTRDLYAEKIWANKVKRLYGWGFMIVGAIFFIWMQNAHSNYIEKILPDQLTSIEGTVSNKLKIEKSVTRRGVTRSKKITIKLNEYPEVDFDISGSIFYASDAQGIIASISPGDNVQIHMLTEMYKKKIAKTKDLTFRDKTINYKFINVIGLIKGNKVYLSNKLINTYNTQNEDTASFVLRLFQFMGLGAFLTGLYLLINKSHLQKWIYTIKNGIVVKKSKSTN